jgi:Heparinase II/III-like protein/Heparinase II/III N-terminus
VKSRFQKLRQTSYDELRVRSSQALAAFFERRGWSRRTRIVSDDDLLARLQSHNAEFRSPAELLDHFCRRTQPLFFPVFTDPNQSAALFEQGWPNSAKETIERASRILNGSFDFLGFRGLNFGAPPDWHLEPIAGKRAPLMHWSRLNYLDAELFGDKKIVWELNRHQYFCTLGQAYWLTGDERYAQTFTSHVEDWIENNPPKLGINWASSLEISFRTISWIWALYFFKTCAVITPELFLQILKVLYLNALHLETFLSTYFSPNTHLTGEALGLFYIGTAFPEFKEAENWRSTGLSILNKQLSRHVQADGVYFEQSTYYHRYTTDFYLHLKILLEVNGETLPPSLNQKLEALLTHLMYITRPDGMTPLIGDDDGGRLMSLEKRAGNDFRATLSTGAALFDRGDYKYVAQQPAEETFWLLGPAGLSRFNAVAVREPEKQSIAFEESGYHVMRDGWSRNANYLFFDCGHHGVDNCGHAHADALSFELAANGQTFLIDPGTYTYTGSKELRDWFRGSQSHNTLTINDESSSVTAGPFSWATIANCRKDAWISLQRFDYIVASHDGYERLSLGALHQRAILFLKNDYWVLRDQVKSMGKHKLRSHFQCDTTVEPLRGADRSVRLIGEQGEGALQLSSFAGSGEWVAETSWVSHCYGVRQEAPAFSYVLTADGSDELITFLIPESIGARPVVREIEALYGRAFELNQEASHDVLLLGEVFPEMQQPNVQTARFCSDFAVAWIRFANERARDPNELILIGGYAIELDGRVLLRSSKRIEYLFARRVGDRFSVKTNEGEIDLSLPVENLELLFSDFSG